MHKKSRWREGPHRLFGDVYTPIRIDEPPKWGFIVNFGLIFRVFPKINTNIFDLILRERNRMQEDSNLAEPDSIVEDQTTLRMQLIS